MSYQEDNAKAEGLAGALTIGCIVFPIALFLFLALVGAIIGSD